MADQQSARVSVIIPARNEEANIARAVRSAAGQQVREIIVVDDASTDRTGEILEGLRREIPALQPRINMRLKTTVKQASFS